MQSMLGPIHVETQAHVSFGSATMGLDHRLRRGSLVPRIHDLLQGIELGAQVKHVADGTVIEGRFGKLLFSSPPGYGPDGGKNGLFVRFGRHKLHQTRGAGAHHAPEGHQKRRETEFALYFHGQHHGHLKKAVQFHVFAASGQYRVVLHPKLHMLANPFDRDLVLARQHPDGDLLKLSIVFALGVQVPSPVKDDRPLPQVGLQSDDLTAHVALDPLVLTVVNERQDGHVDIQVFVRPDANAHGVKVAPPVVLVGIPEMLVLLFLLLGHQIDPELSVGFQVSHSPITL